MTVLRSTIDGFDRRILDCLQRDNTQPQRSIAEKVGLSVPAVARRIQQLRLDKVIVSDVSVINQDAIGRSLTLIVEVTTESERLDLLDEMRQRFSACPQVQQCYYVTGEVDFILIVNVHDMEEYTAPTRDLFFGKGNVKSFRTFVSMHRVKTGSLVILDEKVAQ